MNQNLAFSQPPLWGITTLCSTIDPLTDPERFSFAEIADTTAATIAGGKASTSVVATATAEGPFSYASTQTQTLALGGQMYSIAFGEGTAIAIGNNPTSDVNVSGTGDKVRTFEGTFATPKRSVSVGVVLAVSHN